MLQTINICNQHPILGLSTPNADTTPSTFGHMLSMLFQWFNATAYLPNDKTGTALEKLKSEYLPQWLRNVSNIFIHIWIGYLFIYINRYVAAHNQFQHLLYSLF